MRQKPGDRFLSDVLGLSESPVVESAWIKCSRGLVRLDPKFVHPTNCCWGTTTT